MGLFNDIKNNIQKWQWADEKSQNKKTTTSAESSQKDTVHEKLISDMDDMLRSFKNRELLNKVMTRESEDSRYGNFSWSPQTKAFNSSYKYSINTNGTTTREVSKVVTIEDFELLQEYKSLQSEIESDPLIKEEWDKFMFFRKLRKAEDNDKSR